MSEAKKGAPAPLEQALEAKRKLRAERRAQGLPATVSPRERLAADPTSKAKAIIHMCCQCMGETGSWRKQVRECTSPDCALYNLRPGRLKTKEE